MEVTSKIPLMRVLNDYDYQVAIVGASLAGATLATLLGREGIDTILIDKATFPRAKPCGEGLSAFAVQKLRTLGLHHVLSSIESIPFHSFTLFLDDGELSIPFSQSTLAAPSIGVKRLDLDMSILKTALSYSSVDSKLGSQVREVEVQATKVRLQLPNTQVSSRILVLADGTQSFLARKLKIPVKHDKRKRYARVFSLKGRWESDLKSVAVVLGRGFEIYCTKVAKDSLSICILSTKSEMTTYEKAEVQVRQTARQLGFSVMSIESHQAVGPLGNIRREACSDRTLLVGDACESMDPLAGMGMTHALASAECAAEALLPYLHGKSRHAFDQYAREREKIAKPLRGITRLTYHSLKTPERLRPIQFLAKTPLPRVIGGLVHRNGNTASDRLAHCLASIAGI